MKLYDHIEKTLGKITESWKLTGEPGWIQVLFFKDNDLNDVNLYVTLGLSNAPLDIGNRTVRQELIFGAHSSFSDEDMASFLLTFADHVKTSGKGLLRGESIEGKPLIDGVKASGVYASIPVFWDDEFHVFNGSTPATVFVWLMPIMKSEALFISKNGWNAFEDRLENAHCDFWDLNRADILEIN